jgi:hypothetical protein
LDTRNFEITNFWQRSNYFLVLNSGLAIGFFNLKDTTFAPVLAGLGVFVSVLWYFVTLGSKFWQVHWETKLKALEIRYANEGILPTDLKLFSQSSIEVKAEVEGALGTEAHGSLARFIDSQIVRKPSVTLAMTSLSGIFVAAWFSLFLVNLGAQMRPNPSLEATATGKALGPLAGKVHHPASGPSALPASAPQLKLQGLPPLSSE